MARNGRIGSRSLTNEHHPQHARRYATEGASAGGSSSILYLGLGAVALGGGYYYYAATDPAKGKKLPPPGEHKDDSDAQNKGKTPNSVFKGGDQGFVDLKLESVEEINHNTKKLRFALPEKDDVSGLHIACTWRLLKMVVPG